MRQCGHREGTCAWSTINPPSYANREVLSWQSCWFCLASSPRTLAAAAAQACCQREPALHVGADESDACLSRACLLISGAPITHTLVLSMVPTPLCSPWCFLPSPYPLSFSNPYVPALKVGPPEATRTLVSTWQAERPPLTHHADSKALKMQTRQSQDTPADKDALSAMGSDTRGGGGSECELP